MGSLKPGVQYIYERQGGSVYARPFGADASERIEIGYDWKLDNNPARVKGATLDTIKENQLWHEIRIAGLTNPALQDALDRVKMLYYLGKSDGE